MSITKCDECGYEISIKTDTCPNCGDRITRKVSTVWAIARRFILIIFAIYIFISAIKYLNFN
jgi:RNA polymerase subunit RPABC4/transcription elongation factor Spt4